MNKKISIITLIISFFCVNSYCQNYMTRNGFIGFYSKTPLEDIKAENNQVYAVLDPLNHHIAFAVLIKGFLFPKELMQEHFNENYAESDKYPKATFSGACSGDMQLNIDGIYQVVINGELTFHGVTKKVETTAQLEVRNSQINAVSSFKLNPEDFNISIPGIVREKISKDIEVKVKILWPRLK